MFKLIKLFNKFVNAALFSLLALFFVFSEALAEEVVYFHHDAVGTPIAATDSSGGLLWSDVYSPYGEKLTNGSGSLNERVGYTGHTYDKSTNLNYMGSRYYDPKLGRFMGIDPVGIIETNPHGINRYSYANHNPYKYSDPNGELPFLIPVAIFLAKELVAEGLSHATGGATDFLSARRLATKAVRKVATESGIAEKALSKGVRQAIEDGSGALATKRGSKLPIYDARTLKRMGEDAFHNFPASFEKSILSQKPIVRSNGRSEFLQQGTINGKDGVFHITTDQGGKIMRHRAFIPNNDWARYSKRWELPGVDGIAK